MKSRNCLWLAALCFAVLWTGSSSAQTICYYNHARLEKTKLYQQYLQTRHKITDEKLKDAIDEVEVIFYWTHAYNVQPDKAAWLKKIGVTEGQLAACCLSFVHRCHTEIPGSMALMGFDVQRVEADHPTPWPIGTLDAAKSAYWLKTFEQVAAKYHRPDFRQKADALFKRLHETEAAVMKQHQAVALVELDHPPKVAVGNTSVKFVDVTEELMKALNR